jgi:hypothetical protein
MVLCAGLRDVDNQVFGEEDRADQYEKPHNPNGFSERHFQNYSSTTLQVANVSR